MKVLCFNEAVKKDDDNSYATAAPTGDGFILSKGGASLTVDKATFMPDSLWFIFFGGTYGADNLALIPSSEYVEARDAMASLQARGLTEQVGFLFFADSLAASVVTFNKPVFYDGAFEHVPAGKPRDVLQRYAPSFAKHGARNAAKTELIHQLNPLDSLAAMEKQVDLLTMLLLSLARKQPKDEQPDWLPALESAFDGASSVDDDTAQAAIASLGKYKARVRGLQATYFQKRDAALLSTTKK